MSGGRERDKPKGTGVVLLCFKGPLHAEQEPLDFSRLCMHLNWLLLMPLAEDLALEHATSSHCAQHSREGWCWVQELL